MNKKYAVLSAVLMFLSLGSLSAMNENQWRKENAARLDAIYEANKSGRVDFSRVDQDSALLEEHIKALTVEKKSLDGFIHRNVISGLYKTGGIAFGGTSALFLFYSLYAASLVSTGDLAYLVGLKASEEMAKPLVGGLLAVVLVSGFGMDRMFRWAYQYNQKRDERLKAIEKNIKLDQSIIEKLQSA